MRKGFWVWIVGAAIAVMIAGSMAMAFASPGSSSPGSLKVLAKLMSSRNVGTGTGSHSIAHYAVFTPGGSTRLGDLYQECTTLGRENVLCTFSLVRTHVDEAQIVFGGFVSLADESHTVPITGGTLAYEGATGQAVMTFTGPRKAIITFQMSG